MKYISAWLLSGKSPSNINSDAAICPYPALVPRELFESAGYLQLSIPGTHATAVESLPAIHIDSARAESFDVAQGERYFGAGLINALNGRSLIIRDRCGSYLTAPYDSGVTDKG